MKAVFTFIKNFFLSGLPFGVAMGALFTVMYGTKTGLTGGILSGILFGLAIAAFIAWMNSRIASVQAAHLKDQHVLRAGLANHMLGGISIGGWLFLTDTKLYFVPHGLNAQRGKLTIPLKDVTSADTFLAIGFIPNGLRVTTKDGEESFVVNRHKAWKRAVERAV